MPEIIDAKGLACPQPVVLSKKALQIHNSITVLVDNETAVENVKRLGKSEGCEINVEQATEGEYRVHLSKTGEPVEKIKNSAETQKDTSASGPHVIVISEDRMGRGDDELGYVLIKAFVHTILDLGNLPHTIIFYNTGVKLTVKDSEVIDDLKQLEKEGVEILVCGTCVNFFEITENVDVGIISNMYDIASAMNGAGRLVNP